MGVETAIAVAAIVGAGTAVYSASQKPKMPGAPEAPPSIEEGPKVDTAGVDRQRKRRQAAAAGRSDTLLTGPLGLTGEPAAQAKTLLGS